MTSCFFIPSLCSPEIGGDFFFFFFCLFINIQKTSLQGGICCGMDDLLSKERQNEAEQMDCVPEQLIPACHRVL